MGLRLPACFQSLSTRLLLLTLMWVSFIVASIGYTMMLNWQLEASAAANFETAELRYSVYRMALYAQPRYAKEDFEHEVDAFSHSLKRLRQGDSWQPLELPHTSEVSMSADALEKEWSEELYPLLSKAREEGTSVSMSRVSAFVETISKLSKAIDDYRGYYLWQLRYLQVLLIVLAIGSLFAIMFLLLRWVIRPLERLGGGINRLSGGNLDARVEVGDENEIGRIARGFNRMADRLEDLYNNLEQKVAEKTAVVEEKNRHLAQLYEITSFFSRQRPLDEMTNGFVERILRYTDADACTVTLCEAKSHHAALASSCGLSAELLKKVSASPLVSSFCDAVLKKNYPIVTQLDAEGANELSRIFTDAGFHTAYSFQVRSTSDSIGIYTLFFREDPALSSQTIQLLESFSMHLGVAIDNSRLIERDRQFAVIQERQLLAQGLHDSIAQALSFLNLQVQLLEDAIKQNDAQLRDESLAAIQAGVQECYEDVRELLLNFRERLHKEGFIEGVKTVIDRFEGQAHVLARLQVTGSGPELTERQKLQTIFILQEALSNVRKHAQASNVDIRIDNGDDLLMTITDDGIGIDPKLVAERQGQHVGLSIMAERASRIGATVKAERASPIGGTRVTLLLPASARHPS